MTSIRISLGLRLTCKSDTTSLTEDKTHSQKDSVQGAQGSDSHHRQVSKLGWLVTLLKFILKNCYSRSHSFRSDNSHRPNSVGISICDQYWTILDICPILLQAAVRAPVILLVVYDLGSLGAKNRGMYFPPTSLTGILLSRVVEGLTEVAHLCHHFFLIFF